MPESGLFVTLFDEETLALYLDRGVYGSHMSPEQVVSPYSRHYQTLADYSCARDGTHVFFFLRRHIVYAGQVDGSSEVGAFFLNGPNSPLGSKANAPLVWDESNRGAYRPGNVPGVFTRPRLSGVSADKPVCQPYLLRFSDRIGLKGKAIMSDQLYLELGDFPYPLPTNSISGMSFCTMALAEVRIALKLLQHDPVKTFRAVSSETTTFSGEPLSFSADHGIAHLADAQSEAHLEASILANPHLLPRQIRPDHATLCRQVPICPFKPPDDMDRADICFYNEESIAEGSVPNTIVELKNERAGNAVSEQAVRYATWLRRRLGDQSASIRLYVLAPSFVHNWTIPREFRGQISNLTF